MVDMFKSDLWLADLDEVLKALPEIKQLENKTVMITGAAGLICSSIVDLLIRYNETQNNSITIVAAGRWFEEMTNRFGALVEKDYFKFMIYDASKTGNQLDEPCDYVIHGASNAFPSLIVKEPVETMLSNFTGMKELLDYAQTNQVKRILYISSSEVYGQKGNNKPFKEGEYGYIDLLNSRNSYSVGKRAAETLCASYADEYEVESVIVRPGHIYGPTAAPMDNRVSSAWAFAAARGEDIVMKSDGSQLRSYCYCLDCASAILKVLLKGKNVHAYNISNPSSVVTIKEMAELLARAAEVNLITSKASEIEKKGFNPMSNSSLDSTSLQEIGWKGLFSADRGFAHTVAILKDVYFS